MSLTYLSPEDHQKRISILTSNLEFRNIDTILVFNSRNIFYLTGYSFIPTERPLILIIHKGDVYFFAPRLEVNHIEYQVPFVSEIYPYFDYPGERHPLKIFKEVFTETFHINPSKIISEYQGSPGYWGYKGASLSEIFRVNIAVESDIITDMRVVKEEKEIKLIKESCKWAGVAHKYLQDYTQVDKNEHDVSIKASHQASIDMKKHLGDNYKPIGWTMFPAIADYRGQIGKYSAFPHAQTQGFKFRKGENLVTGASANIYGYYSELERTMFVGEPNPKQKKLFNAMLEMQSIALASVKPGIRCAEVDKAVFKLARKEGVTKLLNHHSGHSIGLEAHERPFLDTGDGTILQEGMVFTCEPGLYDLKLGGFRHSDTFVVTDSGSELLTQYPRELEELTIPT